MKAMKLAASLLTTLTMSTLATSALAGQAEETVLLEKLRKTYPNTQFTAVAETKMKGIYEVLMGTNIGYTNADADQFIFGHLFDMTTGKDVTADRIRQLTNVPVEQLPLQQAIKRVKGDGKRVLVVFTDPDCPFCQKFEKDTVAVLDNVTIYYFLMPLESIHPDARRKSMAIWCANDPLKALDNWFLVKKDPGKKDGCANPIDDNIRLANKLNITGTPTLLRANGDRRAGAVGTGELDDWLNMVTRKQ